MALQISILHKISWKFDYSTFTHDNVFDADSKSGLKPFIHLLPVCYEIYTGWFKTMETHNTYNILFKF